MRIEKEKNFFDQFKHLDIPKTRKLGTVKFLLEKGVSLTAVSCKDESPLYLSMKFGFFNIFEYLMDYSINVLKKYVSSYEKNLFLAIAGSGNYELFKKYVHFGNDANQIHSKNGKTLLMEACKSGNVKIISDIVELGAYLSKKGTFTHIALNKLQKENDLVIEKVLHLFAGKKHVLRSACKYGSVKLVERLLELKADPRKLDGFDLPPIIEAIKSSFASEDETLEILKIFRAAGADFNVLDD